MTDLQTSEGIACSLPFYGGWKERGSRNGVRQARLAVLLLSFHQHSGPAQPDMRPLLDPKADVFGQGQHRFEVLWPVVIPFLQAELRGRANPHEGNAQCLPVAAHRLREMLPPRPDDREGRPRRLADTVFGSRGAVHQALTEARVTNRESKKPGLEDRLGADWGHDGEGEQAGRNKGRRSGRCRAHRSSCHPGRPDAGPCRRNKVHPSEGYLGLQRGGHAGSFWSFRIPLQKEKPACPRVYFRFIRVKDTWGCKEADMLVLSGVFGFHF